MNDALYSSEKAINGNGKWVTHRPTEWQNVRTHLYATFALR